jgi:hypothetical protein
MEDWVKAFLNSLAKGDLQVHGNLAVVPLFLTPDVNSGHKHLSCYSPFRIK